MTNFEKYKNEIEALNYDFGVTENQDIDFCKTMDCAECIFDMSKEPSCVPAKVRWMYKEAQEIFPITKKEKTFLDILWGSTYIARDYSGQLFLYSIKPTQLSDCWVIEDMDIEGNMLSINPGFFPFITWDSDKCWSVEELRQLPIKE